MHQGREGEEDCKIYVVHCIARNPWSKSTCFFSSIRPAQKKKIVDCYNLLYYQKLVYEKETQINETEKFCVAFAVIGFIG